MQARPFRAAPRPLPATLLLAALLAAGASPAHAAKVYRCGNVFQDQPCPELKVADARPIDRAPATRDVPDCETTGGPSPRPARGSGCRIAKPGRDATRQAATEPRP